MTQSGGTTAETISVVRPQALRTAFARGVRDNLVAEVVVQSLRVGGMVFFARALAPANFGVLRALLVITMFATLFCESGIPEALIQRKELTAEHEVAAWWLSLTLVAVTIGGLYVAAPLIASAMAMPDLRFAVRLVCVPLLLEGSAIVSVARLSRALNFGALAMADVVAEISFVVTAFTLLWRGNPEWTLPGGLAARFAAHAGAVWIADRHLPRGVPQVAALSDLGRFAKTVLGGRLITAASGNADFILVGRLLGSSALGYYSMAWDLLRFVPDRLHRVVGRVAFPAFSRIQDDNQKLATAYCNLINYLGRFILPVVGVVAIAAPELLTNIYGPQWVPAAIPMRLLGFGLALVGLRVGLGAIYYAKGRPAIDIYLNGGRLILIVAAVLTTTGSGLVAVSGAVSVVEALISIAGQAIVCGLIGLKARDLATATIPSLRLASVAMIATELGRVLAKAGELQGPVALICVAAGPAIALLVMEGNHFKEIAAGVFGQVSPSLGVAPVE
jgi:PST family polysaccharide transporter